MKTALTATIGIAVLVAIAGVAGLALVAPGALTAPFGGSTPSAGSSPGGTVGGNPAGFGTLAVLVQDAPAGVNWTHVMVTFSRIQAHEANGTNDSGWFNVTTETGTVDLAAVHNVAQLLGTATLPAGMYTQLRLVVSSAQGVMQNGTKVNFTVPSGVLKTDDPFNVTVGHLTSLTLEIDLSRSIVHAGAEWLFLPVFAAVQES
jgi:Domain of unknown function (DUF4382)